MFVKPYNAAQAEWRLVGTTPLENVALPRGAYRWRIEADVPRARRERFVYRLGMRIQGTVIKVQTEAKDQFVVSKKINGISMDRFGTRMRPGDELEIKVDHYGGKVVCVLDFACEQQPFPVDCVEITSSN